MADKHILLPQLSRAVGKIKEWATGLFVAKEAGKGLSTNDLTDELLDKLNNAGDSSFTGVYGDLTGKPSIGGKEVKGGDQTAASLGLATPADIPDVSGFQTAEQVEATIAGKGYQTAPQVSAAVASGTKGLATEAFVTGKGYQTAAQVDEKVDAAVSSVYKPKGSRPFDQLPALEDTAEGDVWNVSDAFTTTEDFVEGKGHAYPEGTNVVCADNGDGKQWDVLSGLVDLTPYMKKADLQFATDADVDALF